MAKQRETIINVDVPLSDAQLKVLAEGALGEGTPADKVRGVTVTIMQQLADGGMMLSPLDMKKIVQSTGIDPASGSDLLPFLAKGTGRRDGMRIVEVVLDPVYESAYEEIAKFQGRTLDDLFNDVVRQILDNEWVYEVNPRPAAVLMAPEDKAELEDLLGAKFENGTALIKLLRNALGADNPLQLAEDNDKVPAGVTA